MSSYLLREREIPLDDSWEVVVVGGGPAGCAAAAAAAREGARTLLVEATGCLGGMGTAGLVPAWCPFSDGRKIIYRGLAERVFNACKSGMPHIPQGALDWVAIDAELLKRIYDDLVTEAGAEVLFRTVLSAVDADGEGGVAALVLSSKAGLSAVRARVYVDCTGDADLAAWAGAEFHKGEAGTGEVQPATHCFLLTNVDEYAYRHGPSTRDKDSPCSIFAALQSGRYPLIRDPHLCNSLVGPRAVGFNAGHLWDLDATDPRSLSRAFIDGRKIAKEIRDALAEFHPAFRNAFLASTAGLMGVRESRRIVGDYTLTVADYLARRSFTDEIGRNSYWIDVHTAKGEIPRARAGEQLCPERYEHYGPGESHGIPYRCLTPRGLRNVLVAGRSISCDRPVQGSVRVMPPCLVMGEAAGMAAAHAAAQNGADVHAVDLGRLRARLREEGAWLPEPNGEGGAP
jgi:glycine/D-amino acid oxidase-like deaminating enzyme